MTKSVKHCGKRKYCLFWAISSFVTMFLKSCLLQRRQKRINEGELGIFLAHLSFAQGELLWSPFVQRPSCVVRQRLLLSNQWVKWDETSQKASSQWPHRISFNFLGSMQNSGFHGNEMKKTSKFFCSQTGWQIFK